MFDHFLQIWIILTSLPGSYLIASKNKIMIKWGFLLLLISQFGYITTSFFPIFKFGLFITSIFFTFSWIKGFWIYWIKK